VEFSRAGITPAIRNLPMPLSVNAILPGRV